MAASETYIQMWLKLGEGKVSISDGLKKNLTYYANFIEEHPEVINLIRHRRVNLCGAIAPFKFSNGLMGYNFLIIEADACNDYEDYLKAKSLLPEKRFWLLQDDKLSLPEKGVDENERDR